MKVKDNIVIYAFRYCLGRHTYAVPEMCDWLVNNWITISAMSQDLIRKEISEAIKRNEAGMSCDVKQWQRVLGLGEGKK